jgi:glycosyltransferase involved in cell wall biosynthesis
MSAGTPRVTVLVPVYNQERFVGEAIESVLGQDFADFELLLVDDGSTDRTPEILREWAARDGRIRVVTLGGNRGIPGALNAGLQKARGELIARLDSDDLMTPGRLAAQLAVLESDPGVSLVSSAYELMSSDGRYLGTYREEHPHEMVVCLLNFFNIVGGGGHVMFRRADALAEGGFAVAYPSSEDYDLWVRLGRRGRIVTLPLIGMRQRDHDNRSLVRYGGVKRANWKGIMGRSLTSYLGRPIGDDEIAALITVWRHDGAPGASRVADRVMREAYRRFCGRVGEKDVRKRLRERIARQWLAGARHFANAGRRGEAWRYRFRALRWRYS